MPGSLSRSLRSARGVAAGAAALVLAAACQHPRGPASAPSSGGERVAIGYGTEEKQNVTGSVSSLDEADAERVQLGRMVELLEGRVPGLQVTRRGDGELSLRIRGARTFSGDVEPLIVIDGVPATSPAAGLAAVRPYDVKRVDVLKGASAAIYGSRGANGVIVITTKRGG